MGQRGLLGDVVDQQEDQLLLPLEGAPEGQVHVGPLSLDVGLRRKGLKLLIFKHIKVILKYVDYRDFESNKD